MREIIYNGWFHMAMVTNNVIISKKTVQLLYTIPVYFIRLQKGRVDSDII